MTATNEGGGNGHFSSHSAEVDTPSATQTLIITDHRMWVREITSSPKRVITLML